MMIKKERKLYIDGLKCLAIFIVFLTHFITYLKSTYICFWSDPPIAYLMRGITGKFGVSILAVCLGYFAYESNEETASFYILRRYFYFFFSGLLINTIIIMLSHTQFALFDDGLSTLGYIASVRAVLKESLCLGDRIYPTFWCMPAFCAGSVIAYLNGRDQVKTAGILVQMLLFWISGQIWVAICLMGCLGSQWLKNKTVVKILTNRPIRAVLLLLAIFFAREEGGNLTNLLNGGRALMIFLLLENSCILKRILSTQLLASTGKNVMSVFILHMPVLSILGRWLFLITSGMDYKYSFLISMVSSWFVTIALAFPISLLLNEILRIVSNMMRSFDSFQQSMNHRQK